LLRVEFFSGSIPDAHGAQVHLGVHIGNPLPISIDPEKQNLLPSQNNERIKRPTSNKSQS